ncbi:hypothetical protein Nepgr_007317 [Nepenthes gracilis]|uniref:Glutaredoxin domain-containing protein n=1 Tax=Nepenthes gracilis TaxID=150966 RepID=A0AAD3S7J8_NEPGR|nr:hypothetical protein Nepgr_007317 [Nepenthes gracilis]
MQETLAYRPCAGSTTSTSARPKGGQPDPKSACNGDGDFDDRSVQKMVSENAAIVFGRRGCCMCHVVRKLLLGLGVNPTMFEVDDEGNQEALLLHQLTQIGGAPAGEEKLQLPVVFIGGRLFGGVDRVIATHISGELVPILRQAGALWL